MQDDPPEDEDDTPKKKISWEMVGIVASIFAGNLPAWLAKVLLASYEKILNKETGDAPSTRPHMPEEDD
mgnify:CR=1 FL=1